MSPHPHRALSTNSDDPRGRVERVRNETGGAISRSSRLTEQQFWALADVPAEAEWFANIRNRHTRRAYKLDVHDFLNFNGIDVNHLTAIRTVTRLHVIAWRKELERRELSPSTIRRKLSAVSALFEFLCESNAIYLNPVNGVERPAAEANEGKTPAIGDAQARQLLASPAADTLKGKRDGAILATFLYHGLRAEELVKLKVKDIQERRGVKHFRVHGKGSKIRYIPIHPAALDRIDAYTAAAGHSTDLDGALFRPTKSAAAGDGGANALAYRSVYDVIKTYAAAAAINVKEFCVHSLRATAATNALDNGSDIAKVQEWLGHANVSTTRLYDKRKTRAEDSPTFKVTYS